MTDQIDPRELAAYADVVVRCGVNLYEGQQVVLSGLPEHAALIAELAAAAYRGGAGVVHAVYRDDRVDRAQTMLAPTDELAATPPPWLRTIVDTVIDGDWARIVLTGDSSDDPFAGAPMARVSAWHANSFREIERALKARIAWNVCPCPTSGWAERVYGEPDTARLWRDLRRVLRLDEPDPVQAWLAHADTLGRKGAALDAAGFAAVRFVGPGTDLRIPLHSDAQWCSALFTTASGRACMVNLPTEEVFTTPDFRGVEGTAAVTRPVYVNGVTVEGLVVRFEGGEIVDVRARTHTDAVEAQIATDPGARRLGEVALVDGSSRVGRLGVTFKDTLIDENATCHIAWGLAYDDTFKGPLPDDPDERARRGINLSLVHSDVMVGGPDVTVLGVTAEGAERPVIERDRWMLAG
jgi:aminopeptidase